MAVSKVTRKTRSQKYSHSPVPPPCEGAPALRFRYPCGCVVTVKNQEVYLHLPHPPKTGKQTRFIGRLFEGTLNIFRNGTEYFRARNAYGIDQHILRAAKQIGFDQIRVVTPARAGFLNVSIDGLLARKPFRYRTYENQIAFKIGEIKAEVAA